MSVEVTDQPQRGRYEATVDGRLAGFAEYQRRDGVVVLTHTEVDDDYQGKGVAGGLARAALDAIRAEGSRVVPECEYMAGYIRKHPEYADLVDESE